MRIIIVEDEALLAICISQAILDAGHEVVCCVPSATRALACANEHGADLALVNISLVEGKRAGVDLAKKLQALDIPSIFVSGQRTDAVSARRFALGFLPKPYTPKDVLGAVSVAEELSRGGKPPPPAIPQNLELF
jgi:two-component SAPR family response regulator